MKKIRGIEHMKQNVIVIENFIAAMRKTMWDTEASDRKGAPKKEEGRDVEGQQ